MNKDNREHSRVEVVWPSTISTLSRSIDGEVKNISLNGAFVECTELPNLEETFDLGILVPEQHQLNTTARIIRLDVYNYENENLSYGLAVRFEGICGDKLNLLDSAISHSRKLTIESVHTEQLAASLRSQLEESSIIVEAILRCFDDKRNFKPELLLNQADILKLYHERISHLLLSYLKEEENRKNRVSLINCIPLFYNQTTCPKSIVRRLLTEFYPRSGNIHYSDRNMLMLTTQLLRHYRKEEGLEIETTPEEVLLVQKGLREDIVEMARETLAELDDQVNSKLTVIRNTLINSLSQSYVKSSGTFSLRFVVALLREFSILMALIGGPHARTTMREVAFFLSNPKSLIYTHPSNRQHQDVILGLLRTNIKGYLRLLDGDCEEYDHLKALKSRIDMLSIASEEARRLLLRRLSGLIENHLR